MTDAELRAVLERADALLVEYERVVMPAAAELARRHNAATGYAHEGRLGCYEEGMEIICLHATGGAQVPSLDDALWLESEEALRPFFAGLQCLSLSAHF